MTKIVRITRHEIKGQQLIALMSVFPEAEIETISETLPTNAREFTARFDEITRDADVVEAVLPPTLLSAVLKFTDFSKHGGLLIRAVMNRAVREDGAVAFTFDHYEVIERVDIVTRRL